MLPPLLVTDTFWAAGAAPPTVWLKVSDAGVTDMEYRSHLQGNGNDDRAVGHRGPAGSGGRDGDGAGIGARRKERRKHGRENSIRACRRRTGERIHRQQVAAGPDCYANVTV